MEIKVTTTSEVSGLKIKKVFERVEVTSATLAKAEAKLIEQASKTSKKVNWLLDVRYYQRPSRKFLMSGTPAIMEEENQP